MAQKRALQIILAIGLFGALFSGTLTYRELFGASAGAPEATCPSPGPAGTILGYPACVYGLFMYVLIVGVASWGLLAGPRRTRPGEGEGAIQRRAGARA